VSGDIVDSNHPTRHSSGATFAEGYGSPQNFDVRPLMKTLLALEAILLALLIFPSYGFDKPSSQGLDFGHLLIVFVIFCITWLLALVVAIKKKHYKASVFKIAYLLLALFLFFNPPSPPTFTAKECQYLIGMSKAELYQQMNSKLGHGVSGITHENGKEYEFFSYEKMEILVHSGRVVEVKV